MPLRQWNVTHCVWIEARTRPQLPLPHILTGANIIEHLGNMMTRRVGEQHFLVVISPQVSMRVNGAEDLVTNGMSQEH